MKLEFDFDKGYGHQEFNGRSIEQADYFRLPIIQWLNDNVGTMKWPKEEGESPSGLGWRLLAEWSTPDLTTQPKVYIIFDTALSERQITEFWIRFTP